MDLSQFHLLKEDNDNYEIGHPNGRKLTVSKSRLSEKAHAAIKKFACGGEVQRYAEGTPDAPVQPVADVPEDTAQTPNQMMSGLLQGAEPQVAADHEFTPKPGGVTGTWGGEVGGQNIPTGQNIQDPLVQNKMDTASLLNKQENDVKNYLGDETKANNNIAGLYKGYANDIESRKTPEDIVAGYKAKDDALMKSYMDGKIDPDRYLKNMSTGSKIAASIGLLFSGFGSGASGQSNFALDHINQAINSDIDAQKNEQGKNLNLYKMNQEALGNDLKAQAATQNQLWTGVQAKIQAATAQSQNPALQLKGQQMINDIEQQKIQNRLKLGLLSQQGGASQGGQRLIGADPLSLVNDMVPEAQRAKATDEISKAQHVAQNQAQMLELFDRAGDSDTGGNTVLRTAGGLRTPPAITALRGLAQPLIKDEAGRPSEIQQKIFEDLLPHPGDTDAHIEEKRANFIKYLNNQKSAPTFKAATGLDIDKFSSANTNTFQAQPKNDQFTAWARANPNDPRAQKYLSMNNGG